MVSHEYEYEWRRTWIVVETVIQTRFVPNERRGPTGRRSILQRTTSHNSPRKREREEGGHRLNRKRSQRIIENRATTDRSLPSLLKNFQRLGHDTAVGKLVVHSGPTSKRPIVARKKRGGRDCDQSAANCIYILESWWIVGWIGGRCIRRPHKLADRYSVQRSASTLGPGHRFTRRMAGC